MSLQNLVRSGMVTPQTAKRKEIRALLAAVRRNLRDARLPGLSAEGRFGLACQAVMQCALVALRAHGLALAAGRPGCHAALIQSLPLTVGTANDRTVVLDGLWKLRNSSDYSGAPIASELVDASLRAAADLENDVRGWLARHRSEYFA